MSHACFFRHAGLRTSFVLLGMSLIACAHAQAPSYTVTGFNTTGGGPYVLGYNFKAAQDIYVTSIGQWILSGDTINNTETMGIYDNTGTLQFSTDYTQANATITGFTDAGGNQFRYTDVTSQFSSAQRKLLANTEYTIAGTDYNQVVIAGGDNLASDPLINLTSVGLYASGGFQQPTNTNIYNIYGVNFQFSTTAGASAPVPEPGSIAFVAGMSLTGAAFLRRKRRK